MVFGSLARLIAIDVRNLAVLRIGLAVIVLIDLAQRSGSIEFFCSDQGILNREPNRWLCPPSDGFWSLYWLYGSTEFAAGLMVVNALAAICLLMGWQTRLATAACLVLAYSLQIRNPLILTAGHILLRLLLFWSLFLPLGAVWSMDAWRKRGKSGSVGRPATARERSGRFLQVVSIASAAIMVQVAAMYFFSGIAKWNDVWLRGEAMSLALQLDMYVKPLGRELLAFPALLMLLTFSILILETVGPLLLWMPIATAQWRVGLMVLFWSMHIGIWLTMSIGIFSLVAMLAWVVFWPSEIWDLFPARVSKGRSTANSTAGAADKSPIRGLGLAPSIVCGVYLAYVVALNIANIEPSKSKNWFGESFRWFGNATMTLQQFKMFERPAKENLWWRLVCSDADGQVTDVLPSEPQSGDLSTRPSGSEIYRSIPDQFWRRLLYFLASLESRSSEDTQRIHALRQKTGEVLLQIRRNGQTLDPYKQCRFLSYHQLIDHEEWESPIEVEIWAEMMPHSK